MQKNTAIQFSNVHIGIKDRVLLENIVLNLYQGEIIFVLGNTGVGKSSLLRAIALDLPINQGQLYVNGIAAHQLVQDEVPYLKRQLGIVNQQATLLPNLSVFQNLIMVLAATGWKQPQKREERAKQVLQLFEIEAMSSKKPIELTQKDRIIVYLARAILNNPTVLLLDGILDSIDEDAQDIIMSLIQLYKKHHEVTVLVSTAHYQLTNRYTADRIIVCKDRTVVEL